jgi:hypothetical protein
MGDSRVQLTATSGTGVMLRPGTGWRPADLGVSGITAFIGDQDFAADYAFTDGVNGVEMQVYHEQGGVAPHHDIAVAIAAAAAAGFE